jgi:hypothetical protein
MPDPQCLSSAPGGRRVKDGAERYPPEFGQISFKYENNIHFHIDRTSRIMV